MKVTTMSATWAALGPRDKDHPFYIHLFGPKVTHGYFGLTTLEVAKKKAEELLAADHEAHAAAVYTLGPDGPDQKNQNGEILRRDEKGWQPWG